MATPLRVLTGDRPAVILAVTVIPEDTLPAVHARHHAWMTGGNLRLTLPALTEHRGGPESCPGLWFDPYQFPFDPIPASRLLSCASSPRNDPGHRKLRTIPQIGADLAGYRASTWPYWGDLPVSNSCPTLGGMGYALAQEQQRFVERLVKAGRYNNQSEVVREALRRMERQERDYLTPPPLTPAQIEAIYGANDRQADTVGRAAFSALRTAARKGAQA